MATTELLKSSSLLQLTPFLFHWVSHNDEMYALSKAGTSNFGYISNMMCNIPSYLQYHGDHWNKEYNSNKWSHADYIRY